jgi:hypothetical protein
MNAMRDFLANIVAAAHISHFLFILGGVVTILIGPGRWLEMDSQCLAALFAYRSLHRPD